MTQPTTEQSVVVRDCEDCFPPRPYPQSHGHTAFVPELHGGFARHIVRSFYTDADDRPCGWQQADFDYRQQRMLLA